jgi:hypothetical protein
MSILDLFKRPKRSSAPVPDGTEDVSTVPCGDPELQTAAEEEDDDTTTTGPESAPENPENKEPPMAVNDPKKNDDAQPANPANPAAPANEPQKKDAVNPPSAQANAATIEQLETAFPDDPKFCMEAMKNKWSIAEAKGVAYDRMTKAAADKAAMERELGTADKGRAPVTHSEKNGGGSAKADGRSPAEAAFNHPKKTGAFWDAVATAMNQKNMTEGQAIKHVVATQPKLHAETFR